MVKKKDKKVLVLLDVHAIVHRAYHALPDFRSSRGESTGALYGLCTMLLKLVKDLKPDYIAACYDLPEPTLRHEAYDGYKAKRKKIDDELISQLERSKDVFRVMNIPQYSSPGFEADDILGTIAEKFKNDASVDVVIASGDMDTMQLISGDKVRVYTLKKGIKDTIVYDEKAVKERFGFAPKFLVDYKGLRGDPSDNIIGVPGIGEKTAEDLIAKFGSVEDIYKKLNKAGGEKEFEKAGIKKRMIELLKKSEEEALFSKTLATIRKDAPVFFQLPEKTWSKSVDMKEVEKLFKELEFKTLGSKVAETLSLKGTSAGEQEKTEEVDQEKFAEAKLMLWVIDSNKTNPDLYDILSFTRTDNLSDAVKVLEKTLQKDKISFVFDEIEKPLMPVVRSMKETGIRIDIEHLKALSKKYHTELSSLEKKIWKLAGTEFNINSPKQLGEVLFVKMGIKGKNQKKTASGGLSTRESELEKLREGNPVISLILEYRELSKLLGTYIDTIPKQVEADGRLHSEFLQAGAATGRMASQNPNLQNIPNKTALGMEIRRAFVSDLGFKLVAFDYSQVELRIAAFLSGDKKLIEIFKTGQDVHTAVASEVFGVSPELVTKEMRRRAKIINFGVMYGMGVLALKQNIGTSKEEASKFLDDYFKKFSGLAKYLEKVKSDVAKTGYTETFFGRRRFFPEIKSKLPFMKAAAERQASNAPIQGTEADIIKLAMIEADKFLANKNLRGDVRLLLQVHDELVYEIKENILESVVGEIKDIMEGVIPPEKTSGIICTVNVSVGPNWAELEKII